MLKVLYFANLDSEIPTIDQDILYSLKKQAEVITFDIRKFDDENLQKIIDEANKCDLFLFHALIPDTNEMMLGLILERIGMVMDSIKCKKVLWFLEKIAGNKMKIVTSLMDKVDLVFVSDETWLRRFESDKIFPLHPAAPEKVLVGKFDKELECDIAFVGSIYGERLEMYEMLKKRFGERFKLFDDKFGKDYADLCKSAKIIIVPQVPFDDFFWSERIYTTLNNEGFCFHPRSQGLQDEGFIDGEHYFTYHTEQDMIVSLTMLLDKKSDELRKQVVKKGKVFIKGQTYGHRIDEIIKKVNENKN